MKCFTIDAQALALRSEERIEGAGHGLPRHPDTSGLNAKLDKGGSTLKNRLRRDGNQPATGIASRALNARFSTAFLQPQAIAWIKRHAFQRG
jgi:hypothetical protein